MRSTVRRLATAFRLAGAGLLAAAALLAGAAPLAGAAEARTVTVRGAQLSQHGRIALEFDEPTAVQVRVANGVLVMTFGRPVAVRAERLAEEMPAYVSTVRRDPDRTALRLALVGRHLPNVLQAGEKVFVDLLPPTWTGLKPGLPPEVVDELARRAQAAEARAGEEDRRRRAEAPKPVVARAALLPTLTRAIFEPPGLVPVSFKAGEGTAEIVFEGALTLDSTEIKGRLAPAVREMSAARAGGALTVRLALAPGYEVRGFREDEAFVVDVSKPGSPILPAESAPVLPDAAPLARAEPAGSAASPKPAPEAKASPEPPGAPSKPPAPLFTRAEARARAESPSPPATGSPAAGPPTAGPPTAGPPVAGPPAAGPVPAGPAAGIQPRASVERGAISVTFPFPARTAAAAFERGGLVTAIFHAAEPIARPVLPAESGVEVREIARAGAFTVVRLALKEPRVMRFSPSGTAWVLTLGGAGVAPSEPLGSGRAADDAGRAVVTVPLDGASGVHWLEDPSGERIAVVTAFAPARGTAKPQRFVDFRLLPTAHGVAVAAEADDLVVRSGIDGVSIARGSGLAVSLAGSAAAPSGPPPDPAVARERWEADRLGSALARSRELQDAVLAAPRPERGGRRMALAHHLLANGLGPEASGALALAAAEDPSLKENRRFALLQAIALVQARRHGEARRMLADDTIADDPEAALWRAVLDGRDGRWPQALAGFRRSAAVLDAYPDDLAGPLRLLAARSGLEAGEPGFAERELAAVERLPPGSAPRDELLLLKARTDEAMGRPETALEAYRHLALDASRPVAAEATGLWVERALADGAMGRDEAAARLEGLAATWRGDGIEVAALSRLGRLHAEAGRWREAFTTAREAIRTFPDHPASRALHDDTARLFEELFLSGKGDTLARVDALALYFDFKELTPIGRRGDEIVRRLADRLVALDLLREAGDLLQHQVDHRLTGAARATVAARLAAIRLMDGKPVEALRAIGTTRLPELPASIRRARMLLEARALSDLSRTDLALENLSGETGPEVERLRADILWSGRRWREAGEAHEALVGTRWQGAEALSDPDRADLLRAAIAYSLGDEALALDRLRAKFAAKMADSADARTFALLTAPNAAGTPAFREIARRAAIVDTLAAFLAEYRRRYPDASVPNRPPVSAEAGADAPKPG